MSLIEVLLCHVIDLTFLITCSKTFCISSIELAVSAWIRRIQQIYHSNRMDFWTGSVMGIFFAELVQRQMAVWCTCASSSVRTKALSIEYDFERIGGTFVRLEAEVFILMKPYCALRRPWICNTNMSSPTCMIASWSARKVFFLFRGLEWIKSVPTTIRLADKNTYPFQIIGTQEHPCYLF